MRLRPFFTYMGGKFRAAPSYPHPLHKTIIEPFAGSAGYSVRHPSRNVILYDIDPKIFGVWDYLIKVSSEEIRQLPLVFEDVRNLDIPIEAQWLIGFWVNKGNTQPCFKPSAWMRSKVREDSQWGQVIRNRIAYQIDKIRHWRVFNKSFDQIDNQKATWYIDPPYIGLNLYKYSTIDYSVLAKWCKNRCGQVIVCENQGAKWLPFRFHKTISATNHPSRAGVSHEAIWYQENQEGS